MLSEVQIELAGICNAHCSYCTWTKRTVGKQMMDYSLALTLIHECKDLGVDLVTFHGVGESLLHPLICDILYWSAKLETNARLSTNCFNLSGAKAEIIRSLPNLTLVLAIPWVEKPKFVEKCVENVKSYLDSEPLNKQIHVQMVCAEGCEKYMDRLVSEFMPYANGNVLLHFKQPVTWPNSEPVKGFIPMMIMPEDKRTLIDIRPTPVSIAQGCTMPERMLQILADGTIVPCCVGMDEWGLGKIQGRTLKEVWEGVQMAEMRDKWRRADDSIPCGHCKKRQDVIQ